MRTAHERLGIVTGLVEGPDHLERRLLTAVQIVSTHAGFLSLLRRCGSCMVGSTRPGLTVRVGCCSGAAVYAPGSCAIGWAARRRFRVIVTTHGRLAGHGDETRACGTAVRGLRVAEVSQALCAGSIKVPGLPAGGEEAQAARSDAACPSCFAARPGTRPGAAAPRARAPSRVPGALPGGAACDTEHRSDGPGPQAGRQPCAPGGGEAASPTL
jgi:hypothetical protein